MKLAPRPLSKALGKGELLAALGSVTTPDVADGSTVSDADADEDEDEDEDDVDADIVDEIVSTVDSEGVTVDDGVASDDGTGSLNT